MPLEEGGFDGDIYRHRRHIQTRRITQMARGHGLDLDQVLGRIHVARAYNSAHQML